MQLTALKPMLAQSYDGQDVDGWLMSEKMDGVRGLWNGEQFLSRNGNVFDVPEWFKSSMPSVTLDGELWMGRGRFQETVGIVRSNKPQDPRWHEIKFHVFDAPMFDGGFSDRLKYCAELLESNSVAAFGLLANLASASSVVGNGINFSLKVDESRRQWRAVKLIAGLRDAGQSNV